MIKRLLVIVTLIASLCTGFIGDKDYGEVAKVPIVMYHSVCKSRSNNYVITPSVFESDMKFLKENGYNTVFVRDLISFVQGNGKLPDNPIVVTLDDGFYNNLFYVLPILEKYDYKATVSVVGKYSNGENSLNERSPSYSYLNSGDLNTLVKSGRIELGNHTFDMHKTKGRKGIRKVCGETTERYASIFSADTKKCHDYVKISCGTDMNVFTYPYGYYNDEAREILSDIGYKAMLTCNEGMNILRRGSNKELKFLKRYNRPASYSTQGFFKHMKLI